MQYDTEHCWNPDTDKMDKRKLKVKCPHCERLFAALCSQKTKLVDHGMQWCGEDYEGYSQFITTCSCKKEFKFTTVCS